MRLLPERADHDRQGAAGQDSQSLDAQIREGMNGVLCRCMTFYRVQAAIKRGAKAIADARQSAKTEVTA